MWLKRETFDAGQELPIIAVGMAKHRGSVVSALNSKLKLRHLLPVPNPAAPSPSFLSSKAEREWGVAHSKVDLGVFKGV